MVFRDPSGNAIELKSFADPARIETDDRLAIAAARRIVIAGVDSANLARGTPEDATDMPKAIWNDTVVAESDATVVVEGNHYFPPDSIRWDHLTASESRSTCPWKGEASYYHVEAGGSRSDDAAWSYSEPKPAARQIAGYVAFWKGVRVD